MIYGNNKIANAGFLAMMMVVGIHVAGCQPAGTSLWWWEQLTHYGVFTISVPFFFICSGFFLARHADESGWYRTACVKRARSLLVPYLCWSLIAASIPYVMVVMANLIHCRALSSNINNIAPIDWLRVFGLDLFDYPGLVPLWYVRALMIFVIISPVIIFGLRKLGVVALALMYIPLVLFATSSVNPRFGRFFGYFFNLSGLFWFSLGCWIALNRDRGVEMMRTLSRNRHWALLVGLTLLFAQVLLGYLANCQLRVLGLIYVPLLLWAFWAFVPGTTWSRQLTQKTFAIFLLHVVVKKIITMAFHFQVVDLFSWGLMWLMLFIGSFVIAVITFRGLPRTADLLFGGRV